MIIESHIHLSGYAYDNEFPFIAEENGNFVLSRGNREDLIKLYREADIAACIEPAIEFESNERILALAAEHPGFLYPAIGIHPTRTYNYFTVDKNGAKQIKRLRWSQRKDIRRYASMPGVVAVGETGLDYHLARRDQHRLRQIAWFIWHIRLADQLGLPLILHVREADRDALLILHLFRKSLHGGVCHCFSGDSGLAKKYTDLGLMIGIGGQLLSKQDVRRQLEDAVAETPAEYLLVETDGPYVKPECPDISGKQLRKARNTSLILPQILARIAELKGVSPDEIERITTENVLRVFRIREQKDV